MFNAFFGGGGGGGGGGRQFHFSTGGSGQGFQFQAGGFPGGGFPDGAGFGGGGGGPRMRQQRGPGAAGMYDDDANVLNLDQDSFPGTGKDNPWVYLVSSVRGLWVHILMFSLQKAASRFSNVPRILLALQVVQTGSTKQVKSTLCAGKAYAHLLS